jgi:phage antirepressor YoqD-like protein
MEFIKISYSKRVRQLSRKWYLLAQGRLLSWLYERGYLIRVRRK